MFLTVILTFYTFFIDDLESYYINDSFSAKRLDTAFPTIFLMSSNGGIFILMYFLSHRGPEQEESSTN